jgi:hypothetical protein
MRLKISSSIRTVVAFIVRLLVFCMNTSEYNKKQYYFRALGCAAEHERRQVPDSPDNSEHEGRFEQGRYIEHQRHDKNQYAIPVD